MAMVSFRILAVMFVGFFLAAFAVAQEPAKLEPLPEISSATALAIRPSGNEERYELLVATDGRIFRIASDAIDKPEVIVTGSGKVVTAIQFINGKTFVVATADVPSQFRAYELPEEGQPLAVEQSKFEVRAAEGVDGLAAAMTLGPTALFVVGSTNESGWLLRSRVRNGVPGDVKPFARIGARPTCVAISTRGWVVVGDAGKSGESEDSRLTFLHPSDSTAKPALEIELGLLDVAAISYSPRESLYAADTAEANPDRSGIYRIDMDSEENRIGGKAVRVLSVENPTSMCFAPDGALYVITRSGKLFRAVGIE